MMRGQKRLLSRTSSKNAQSILLLAPFMFFFVIFTVLPILTSIFLSFFSFDMINEIKFVGFGNYLRMIAEDDIFPIVLKNTIVFAIM